MRLIDADALILELQKSGEENPSRKPIADGFISILRENCPTIEFPRDWTPCAEGQDLPEEQKLELLNGGDFDVIDIPAALAYLESVEEILPHASALIDLIQSLKGTAIELTARAEQAEADIKKFAHTSHTCGHNESGLCKLAADDHGFCEKCPAWVYRGQPQDGEGK